MTEKTCKAAIFDLDGTLLDTLEDLYLATNRALARHGLPSRARDEVRRFVGNGVETLIRRAVPEATEETVITSVLADFKATYATVCQDHTAPYEGILPLLTALREAGISVAVVSNKFDEATKRLCAEYFGDLVQIAVGERTGIRKKPAPDTVNEALRALGAAPETAVYIGDSDVDIETARNARMPCLSVTWGFRDEAFLLAHGAATLVRTPEELFSRLFSNSGGPLCSTISQKTNSMSSSRPASPIPRATASAPPTRPTSPTGGSGTSTRTAPSPSPPKR